MDREEEKLLVKKAKNGNMEAFEQLVSHNEKIVYNVIYRIINNSEDTYDLAQDTFIKAYTRIHQFNEESKFSTWLYRIATNTALDELRRRKGKETFSINQAMQGEESEIIPQHRDENENVEEKIIEQEKGEMIEIALKELSEEHRVILILRDMQSLSYDEISKVLDITLGTVKSRISRARREMKNILMQDKEPYVSYFRHNHIRRDRHEL